MNKTVVLFDGVCNLCQDSVRFIINRDPRGCFTFASRQSAAGISLMEQHAVPEELDAIVLIQEGSWYGQSTAALRICRKLNRLWPLLYAFIVIPRPLRDALYRYVARNRYRWFGKLESCPLPDPQWEDRFL